jgi:hypothetical protein
MITTVTIAVSKQGIQCFARMNASLKESLKTWPLIKLRTTNRAQGKNKYLVDFTRI